MRDGRGGAAACRSGAEQKSIEEKNSVKAYVVSVLDFLGIDLD